MATTPFDTGGIPGRTGKKHVAALKLPYGLLTDLSNTIQLVASTVTTSAVVPVGSAKVYNGMAEDPAGSGMFYGISNISGAALPDSGDGDAPRPYEVEVREVADATDLSSYAAITTAFEASTVVRYSGIGALMSSGYLNLSEWTNRVDIRFINGEPTQPVDNVEGSGDDVSIQIIEESVNFSGSDAEELVIG